MSNQDEELITFITNILKFQVMPMNLDRLKDLLNASQNGLKSYVDQKYSGTEFKSFFQKHPELFKLNNDETIELIGNMYCMSFNSREEDCDEVDGIDIEEYISAPESDSEEPSLPDIIQSNRPHVHINIEDPVPELISDSSIESDSSKDNFSSEIIQTSDSLCSSESVSSHSSVEN